MLSDFFKNGNAKLPSFIESIDELQYIRVVRLRGPIDMKTIPMINSMRGKMQNGHGAVDKDIILNFEKVTHVDTATCASLIHTFSMLKCDDHRFVLSNISDTFKALIDIEGLRELLPAYDSEEDAIKALSLNRAK